MAALGSNRSIDGGLNGGPQRAQCGIVDHFLARGEHELQRWGVDDINPGGPRIRSIDFFDRRQSTGDLDAVKIDARLIHEVIAARKDAEPATIPFRDAMGSLEEIFARQKFAVKMDRKREMPRSGLDLGAKIAEPFLGHGDDDLCPRPDPTAFNSQRLRSFPGVRWDGHCPALVRSEEHTSELQSLMRISYAVFCLKKKKQQINPTQHIINQDSTNQK